MRLQEPPLGRKPSYLQPYAFYGEAEVGSVWRTIEPFIERSVRAHTFETITTAGIRELLVNGDAIVFALEKDGELVLVLTATIVQYPHYASARIVSISGRHLREASRYLHILEEWAKSQHAIMLEAWCRPAMVRMLRSLGWTERTTLVTRSLKRALQ